ncbi:hypothetical protein BKA93DRAFT_735014 [Sparassis latifolia]
MEKNSKQIFSCCSIYADIWTGDDVVQHLLYHSRKVDSSQMQAGVAVDANGSAMDMDTTAKQLPSQAELTTNTVELLRSLVVLARVLITSSTFNTLLSDALAALREMVTDTVAHVGRPASRVEDVSAEMEGVIRPGSNAVGDLRRKATESSEDFVAGFGVMMTKHDDETQDNGTSERAKEAIVSRLQESMLRASRVSAYREALRMVLLLLRKYSSKLSTSVSDLSGARLPTVVPVVWAEPPLSDALSNLVTILERLASGHSLDALLNALQTVTSDVINIPLEAAASTDTDSRRELQAYLTSVGEWLDHALASARFAASPEGRRDIETLYDRGRALMDKASEQNAEWVRHVRDLVHEMDTFTSAMASDRTSRRLLRSLDTLTGDIALFSSATTNEAPAQAQRINRRWWRRTQRDVLVWLIPRILRAIKAIPMPRVEYKSGNLDVVIDTSLLTPGTGVSASLIPDRIRVENYSELQVDVTKRAALVDAGNSQVGYSAGGVQTYTRTRVHVNGLRVSARNIGYYVHYERWHGMLGYEDQGLLSVDVGRQNEQGEGLTVDVELDLQTGEDADGSASEGNGAETLFRVTDVSVDVPGLQFAIYRSKHWLLNKFIVQPLSGPLVRAIAGHILAQQIRTLLEALGRFLAGVQRTAEGLNDELEPSGEVSYEDYWEALLLHARAGVSGEDCTASDDSDSSTEEESQTAALVETHTRATLQGMIRTTVTQPFPSLSDPPTPDESALAVGIGPQILPGKGGPVDGPRASEYGAVDITRGAMGELQGAVECTNGTVESIMEQTAKVREEVEEARERGAIREGVERRRKGWKSRVFDMQ